MVYQLLSLLLVSPQSQQSFLLNIEASNEGLGAIWYPWEEDKL